MRGPRGSADDDALVRRRGHTLLSPEAIADRGPRRVANELRERIGARPVYVTFDLDAIDPAYAPGTGTPVPGGLTSREALALVRGLAGLDLCGADLVEYCPPLDHADLTAHHSPRTSCGRCSRRWPRSGAERSEPQLERARGSRGVRARLFNESRGSPRRSPAA